MRSTLWSTGSQVNSALLLVSFDLSSSKFCGRSSGSENKQRKWHSKSTRTRNKCCTQNNYCTEKDADFICMLDNKNTPRFKMFATRMFVLPRVQCTGFLQRELRCIRWPSVEQSYVLAAYTGTKVSKSVSNEKMRSMNLTILHEHTNRIG